MNRKVFFVTLGMGLGLFSYATAEVPSDILESYYTKSYESAVKELVSRRDLESKVFLAKTYVAMDQSDRAHQVISHVHVDPAKHVQMSRYIEYLNVITARDLTRYAGTMSTNERKWSLWPSTFRNRAKWLIASECLRQNKTVQAENILLSLKAQDYSPRDVQLSLIKCAISQKQTSKGLVYYKELIQKFPDADSQRQLYKSIVGSSSEQTEFKWQSLFNSSSELYPVFKTAFDKRMYALSIEIGNVLLESQGYSSYEFLYLFAKANFERKQYDKSLELLKFFESDTSVNEQVAQALFLKAQCFQKKTNYADAVLHYRDILNRFPTTKLADEVYFNLYWVYRAQNQTKEFLPDFAVMKQRYSQTANFDKVCWELGWEAYIADRRDEALKYFQMIPGNLDDEFKARVLYWSAKSCEREDPVLAERFRGFCISKYAFTYYGTRLLLNSPAPVVSKYISQFETAAIPKDRYYLMLFDLGLGEWAAQLLEDDLVSKTQTGKLEKYYTLAVLYQKMHQPNKAIRVLRKFGVTFSPQEKPFSRELAEMLYPRAYWDIVKAESQKYGLDPYFVLSVMRQESEFKADARSKSGAMGLMQIMPATAQGIAKSLKVEWTGEEMMDDPEMNIRFGVYYLSVMNTRFNGNWVYMLSGYNAGPNITKRWVDDSSMQRQDLEEFVVNIPYSETHYYVMKILKNYWVYKMLYEKGDQTRYAQATSY